MKRLKSGKQRRVEIMAARVRRQERCRVAGAPAEIPRRLGAGCVAVTPDLLRPNNSYGAPEFARRGYYEDIAFRCVDCGAEGVWFAERQRWWYEVAGGDVFTTARRCPACRAKERLRKEQARQVQLAGLFRKALARQQ